jgi:hypothetical protein
LMVTARRMAATSLRMVWRSELVTS